MICLPAFVYLVLCCIQIILDFIYGLYNTAIIKIIVTIILTFILNLLCYMDLGFIAWVIVLVPFIFMSVMVTIILYLMGYDAATGTIDELLEHGFKIIHIKKMMKAIKNNSISFEKEVLLTHTYMTCKSIHHSHICL